MDFDPEVWALVEKMILGAVGTHPAFPYEASDALKLQQWKDAVAGPMWRTANDGVSKPAELQKVSNFDAQVAGQTQRDAVIAFVLSIVGIMVYIWARFGNFKYGTATVVSVVHDTLFVLAEGVPYGWAWGSAWTEGVQVVVVTGG